MMVKEPPKVFVKGFYIGGTKEMLKVSEEGLLGDCFKACLGRGLGLFVRVVGT